MAAIDEEYKAKLRKRNLSQLDEIPEAGQGEILNEITEEDIEGQSGKSSKATQVDFEAPVVNIEDFAVVEMEDKMNLLMSAINKVNTNFHLKWEALQSQIKTSPDTFKPRIQKVERACEEMLARIDDSESNSPNVQDVIYHLETLEADNAQLKNELATVKGILQVQDKVITDNKNKVIDLTACSMANNVVITGLIQPNPVADNEEN